MSVFSRPGVRGALVVGAVLGLPVVLLLGAGLWLAAGVFDRGPYVDDPRACATSNLELGSATDRFELEVPEGARGLRYARDLHPLFGDTSLELTFEATPTQAEEFLRSLKRSSHDTTPVPADDLLHVDACLGLHDFHPTRRSTDTGPYDSPRQVAVQTRGTSAVVWLRETDAP